MIGALFGAHLDLSDNRFIHFYQLVMRLESGGAASAQNHTPSGDGLRVVEERWTPKAISNSPRAATTRLFRPATISPGRKSRRRCCRIRRCANARLSAGATRRAARSSRRMSCAPRAPAAMRRWRAGCRPMSRRRSRRTNIRARSSSSPRCRRRRPARSSVFASKHERYLLTWLSAKPALRA